MTDGANELAACSGGQAVVRDSEVIGRVSLPISRLRAKARFRDDVL
jgi:hypothetical protein